MIMRALTVALCLAASAGGSAIQVEAAAFAPPADGWTIGPIIRGQNYSRGMPLHPTPGRGGTFHIDVPPAPRSVHYVTFPHGSLAGKSRIVMRYRVTADPGVRIVPRTVPSLPSQITPYFQRAGDSWSGNRQFETYRWYATFATKSPIAPGEYRIVAPLNANWTAVRDSSARTNPRAFREALADADQVGFVLGGGDGYGHGIQATGRARLTILEFRVE